MRGTSPVSAPCWDPVRVREKHAAHSTRADRSAPEKEDDGEQVPQVIPGQGGDPHPQHARWDAECMG